MVAELIYEFAEDGTYGHAGVLLQQRDTGVFSVQRSARGTVDVTGGSLTLRPEEGTLKVEDPDVPSASRESPIDTSPETFEWSIDDRRRLSMTDTSGSTIEYARE